LPPRPANGAEDPSATYFAVWRADGSLVKVSALPSGIGVGDLWNEPVSPQPRLTQRGEYREAVQFGTQATTILVGRSVQREGAELRAFAVLLIAVGVVVLAVGLVGGWLVSARILRPLAAISATASAISATNLSGRIDAASVDRELAELAGVLNAMFDRLEAAFERQSRFTADASHELRTPLAILRSQAELALSRPRTSAEYRETIEACLRASGRMAGLVDGLLTLARADAGKLDLRREPVNLRSVVEECIEQLQPLAKDRKVSLSAQLEPAEVIGDGLRLGQVVSNLLSNAVQYNWTGGEVLVHLHALGREVRLSVKDTGCGIPEADRPHLFERFYRVDKARSRASGGSGLGLAICQSIVETHGGMIGFETELGKGSTFWVRLPCHAQRSGNR
jgi:heavy metal sensor kinase